MEYKPGTSRILTNQLQKAKDKRDDLELARAMRNLDLNDDAMDIDTASFGEKVELREKDGDVYMFRAGSKKKSLALGGEVNGIAIQCLADTCANASFIQRAAAEELGLVIDKSITHNISGAPGTGRTYGMVKSVSIQLTPECVITEDLAVLDGYKHREIGLSRTCLKRYNYDVH
ncbi:unnamed protein product [Rhizophagus irregularis]|nr:unnamed protein product [Rhizophagus irregularis]